ncbi:MAG: indolepyruvate oxidoreductase subunit beta [Erysipelotrichaceae bacterium]|nr:indolepyruvate oxidoreductase subunit beta [Erysipelotrichaceae bacterium]
MVKSIVLVGVGGQGTILVSKILTAGLLKLGYDVKMSEIHGMSQRGGSVTTMIKYGDKVYAPNIGIGEADMIVSFEKIEAVRALPYLKKGGIIVTDDREIHPMSVLTGAAEYPHDALDKLGETVENLTVLKANEIAEELGNVRVSNVVLLGSLVKKMGLDQEGIDWKELVGNMVPAKAKEINLLAFERGYAL